MNAFSMLGDASYLLSFAELLRQMITSRSSAGASLKTHEMYALVFAIRYVDLAWRYNDPYRAAVKALFISASLAVVYVMRCSGTHCDTYSREDDTFPRIYLIVPAALLGCALNQDAESLYEIGWAFSVYLEAVAILPQLLLLQERMPLPATV